MLSANLRGAPIYIYNFLDVRRRKFGRRVLEQLDRQLNARLTEIGIPNERLYFLDSTPGLSRGDETSPGLGTYSLPISETVNSNLTREAEFGARYRLIIIPASFTQVGARQSYEIRWMLTDVATGGFVWSFVTSNSRVTLWRSDENSEQRARALLDEVFADLRALNLIDPVADTE